MLDRSGRSETPGLQCGKFLSVRGGVWKCRFPLRRPGRRHVSAAVMNFKSMRFAVEHEPPRLCFVSWFSESASRGDLKEVPDGQKNDDDDDNEEGRSCQMAAFLSTRRE